MTTTQEYIEALRCYKAEKSEQYGISRIGIFGSVARGEQDGDSDVDVATGHNAGLAVAGAAWGFRGRVELETAGADAVIETPADLLSLIDTR